MEQFRNNDELLLGWLDRLLKLIIKTRNNLEKNEKEIESFALVVPEGIIDLYREDSVVARAVKLKTLNEFDVSRLEKLELLRDFGYQLSDLRRKLRMIALSRSSRKNMEKSRKLQTEIKNCYAEIKKLLIDLEELGCPVDSPEGLES